MEIKIIYRCKSGDSVFSPFYCDAPNANHPEHKHPHSKTWWWQNNAVGTSYGLVDKATFKKNPGRSIAR